MKHKSKYLQILSLIFLLSGSLVTIHSQTPSESPKVKPTPKASPTPSQIPPYVQKIIIGLNNEISKAYALLEEGQKLSLKGSSESIKAREKLNQAIKLVKVINQNIKDKTLLSKINSSGETANESLNRLKLIEFYTKLIDTFSLQSIAQTHANLNERLKELEILKLYASALEKIINDKTFVKIGNTKYPNIKKIIQSQKLQYAGAIGNIGHNLQNHFGRFEEAINYLERSVKLFQKFYQETPDLKFKWFEARQLSIIGLVYGKDSKTSDIAIKYFNNAIEILKTLPNMESEVAGELSKIGTQESLQFNFEKSITAFNESLNIYRKLNNKSGQVRQLRQIALIYYILNDKTKVAEYAKQTLAILQSTDYSSEWSKSLKTINPNLKAEEFGVYEGLNKALFEWDKNDNIAFIYRMLEDYEKSLVFYKKAFEFVSSVNNPNSTQNALSGIALIYAKLEKWNKAAEYYKKVLELSRKIDTKEEIAGSLQDVGWTLMEAGKQKEALMYQNEALALYQSEGISEDKIFSISYSSLLSDISRTYQNLGNKSLAIFYGKRTVNSIQGERLKIQNLNPIAQKGFLEKKEKHYRRLADWLMEEGRLVEAEQVLAMLKEEEVADFLKRDVSEIEKLQKRADLTPAEKDALSRYKKIANKVSALGLEYQKLREFSKNNGNLNNQQQKRYDELSKQVKDTNNVFQVFLRELADEFSKRTNLKTEFRENKALKKDLKDLGENVVFLHTLVSENRYRVILTTRKVQTDGKKEISEVELTKKILEFRQQVQNPNVDPRPLGKKLYDIIIKPIEKQLEGAEAKTLLWSLDGNLRLLPLAALWDGKKYFGQKYQNVIVTGASRLRLKEAVSKDWKVLGLGVSEAKTVSLKDITGKTRQVSMNALPAVVPELSSIVLSENNRNGVLPGVSLLNNLFTKKNLEKQLLNGFKVIHIASHFSLNAGDATKSFLLLGDGTALTVSDFNSNPELDFEDVELLTLSACQTAVTGKDSTGKEIEGFAYVAQQKGAKAILATLWSVADESTQLLMTEFYRLRKENPNLTKSEAIQMAQESMLEGKLKPKNSKEAKKRAETFTKDKKANAPKFEFDESKPYSHPYYWSPFVLIGNWK